MRSKDRQPRRAAALLCALLVALTALAVLAVPASAGWLSPGAGPSDNAQKIDTLYWVVFVISIPIFVGVEGALIYAMVKFRARKGAVPAQIRGNTRLEIGWTLGAAVIVVVLAVVTFAFLPAIRNPPPTGPDGLDVQRAGLTGQPVAEGGVGRQPPVPEGGNALNIDVNGQQYVWRYTYADNDDNNLNNVFAYQQMVVPTNTTVVLSIRSQDVAHSWWIPSLGGKFDAIPGYTNYTWYNVSEPGVWGGRCAELCGRNHANMVASVRAVTPEQFQRWYTDKRRQIAQANAEAARQRQQVEGGTPAPGA
ncbi:MAG TPA: cytochrome c oxidase subunit II [Solirubrobacteraceae bacterium]|nr:cytochrome c oxidase subunit II [Solirubrobacteraceae bacterium]